MCARYSGVTTVLLMIWLAVAGSAMAADDLGLVEAAKAQDQSAVRSLLDRKADVNARANDGSTALLWAAHWDDVATADLLIRARADANLANDFGMTPLSRACTNGSAAMVQRLLEAGANPNTRIATGETPLMTCASSGNVAAVRLLIARGADVNAAEPSGGGDVLRMRLLRARARPALPQVLRPRLPVLIQGGRPHTSGPMKEHA